VIENIVAIAVATMGAATPLVYAALGELITEKSGTLNLGVEGMMLVGAIAAFGATFTTGSVWLGIGAGMFAGCALALVFAFLTLTLKANQVASGLAMAILGAGLSAMVGRSYVGVALPANPVEATSPLIEVPFIGPLLFSLHPLVYLSWVLFGTISWFLYKSRGGLVLRAVGESPTAAHAIGYHVIAIRYLATLFGGAMAGIAGAYLGVIYTPLWMEGMTAGRGWIAIALVVFATWKPGRVMIGAYLFGGVTIGQLFAQVAGVPVPPEAMSALPYLATIFVLVIISRNLQTIRLNAPVSLGRAFHEGV